MATAVGVVNLAYSQPELGSCIGLEIYFEIGTFAFALFLIVHLETNVSDESPQTLPVSYEVYRQFFPLAEDR